MRAMKGIIYRLKSEFRISSVFHDNFFNCDRVLGANELLNLTHKIWTDLLVFRIYLSTIRGKNES